MSSDDRPRKSWREIDRQRDQKQQRDERERRPGRGRGGGNRSYRAALDRLFDSGKISEVVAQKAPEAVGPGGQNRIKALAKIRDAGNRDEVTTMVDTFLKDFGELPDDIEIWARLLEHRDPERQMEGMERIDALLETQTPKRSRALLGQLRMIRDVGDEPEMVDLAKRLIERLE